MNTGQSFFMTVVLGIVALAGLAGCGPMVALDDCYHRAGLGSVASTQEKTAIIDSCGKAVSAAYQKSPQ